MKKTGQKCLTGFYFSIKMTIMIKTQKIVIISEGFEMSPRSLSDHEKQMQRQRLLEKGRELLMSYGVRKTSIDDITRAAGMAKGTFYNHFDSKEEFVLEIISQLHTEWHQKAELYFSGNSPEPLKERVRSFIRQCFYSGEFLALFKYHDEFEEVLMTLYTRSIPGLKDLMEMENEAYERLLNMFRVDTQRVKPGVVHNYLHAMYFGIANAELMEKDCLDETFEVLLNGLIEYIFGGWS